MTKHFMPGNSYDFVIHCPEKRSYFYSHITMKSRYCEEVCCSSVCNYHVCPNLEELFSSTMYVILMELKTQYIFNVLHLASLVEI